MDIPHPPPHSPQTIATKQLSKPRPYPLTRNLPPRPLILPSPPLLPPLMPRHKHLNPPPLKPRQFAPRPLRPSQPPHLLKIFLELWEHHVEAWAIAFFLNPVLFPLLLGLEWRKGGVAREDARSEYGLPLEDLEREACAHRADEEE